MSDFKAHLEKTKLADGSYDLAAAERSRVEDILKSKDKLAVLAEKAAKAERLAYESKNRQHLKKVFMQPALSPELDLDAMVPIGDNKYLRMGVIRDSQIRQRMDLTLRQKINYDDAFNREQEFWLDMLSKLPPGGTVADRNIE